MGHPASVEFRDHHECEVLNSAVHDQLAREPQWGKRRHFRVGSFVWIDRDAANRIFLLESGRVQVSNIDEEGLEKVVQVVQPGQMFGELCFCFYSAVPHGYYARATTAASVREAIFGEGATRHSLLRDISFTTHLVGTFCSRLADAENRLRILAIHDGRRRVEQALLYFTGSRGRVSARGKLVALTIGHAELAAFTAMTRPHTTVIMTRLRDEKVISYGRGSALTVNVRKLPAADATTKKKRDEQ